MGDGVKVTVKHREGCVEIELQDRGRVVLSNRQAMNLRNLLDQMKDGEIHE